MVLHNDSSGPPAAGDIDRALAALQHGDGSELDALLATEDAAGPRLCALLCALLKGDGLPEPAPVLAPDERVGGYRITGILGRGGMGVVYDAEQDQPRRRVALKMSRGLDDFQVALFRREGETLARLKHPAFATIYDAGRTAAGYHYFVMEHVDGLPFNKYVRQRGLSLRQSLQLFRQLCEAISHAHQSGVIHRDLKPSNIQVDAQGRLKVLDFGLARLIGDPSRTTVAAEVGRVLGTLAYASPEQVRGDACHADVRSDVYSLGVMLYELITGRLPYDLRGLPLPAAVRRICEQPAPAPRSIVRTCPRELEAIVLKTLEKEPARRYASAAALAEDIGNYLTGRPVSAHPLTAAYQLHKFVTRHKAGCALALGIAMALLGFTVALGIELRRTERAERAARRGTRFLEDMLTSIDPTGRGDRRRERNVGELLQWASERLDQLTDEPLVEADLRQTIGRTYYGLGDYKAAEAHLNQAIQLYERVDPYGVPEQMPAALRARGKALCQLGQLDEALECCQRAVDTAQRRWGRQHAEAVYGLIEVGNVHVWRAEFDAAADDMRAWREESEAASRALSEALAVSRGLLPTADSVRADALTSLGELYFQRFRRSRDCDDFMASRAYLEEGSALYARAQNVDDQAKATSDLADLSRQAGALGRAEELHRTALTLRHQLGRRLDEATSLLSLAVLLRERGRTPEAAAAIQDAVGIYRAELPSRHTDLASALFVWADCLAFMGQHQQSEPLISEALEIWQEIPPPQSWRVSEARSVLGDCLTANGRCEEAKALVLAGYYAVREAHQAPFRVSLAAQRVLRWSERAGEAVDAAIYRDAYPDAPAPGACNPDAD